MVPPPFFLRCDLRDLLDFTFQYTRRDEQGAILPNVALPTQVVSVGMLDDPHALNVAEIASCCLL